MGAVSGARRVVIKIGSALLVDRETGLLRDAWLASLCDDVALLRADGAEVMLVSSGSIALGRSELGLAGPSLTLEQSQAAAAVGQIRLAAAYDAALKARGLRAAQVLLTLEDSEDRRRYLNTRATLAQLLALGVVPIVNENDTVATDEIRYGDNDRMAAQVAVTAGADRLILLSDVDGFYSANPAQEAGARRFDEITEITPEIEAMAGDAGSGLSKGGMKTKLMAARAAMAAGCDMAITEGSRMNPVRALEDGAAATWFRGTGDPQARRKAWIAGMKPRGRLFVDAGAVKAIRGGASLLPAGVTGIEGRFGRGDPVTVQGPDGARLGQGLVRYEAEEINLIKGLRSEALADVLGYPGRGALLHRDDMAF
ncbi:glutamate 5-kinase [Roseovarius sp. SCSIO 43702]|uniref:glutamate 5-kinase n=1 Tax=Roseovarius sp. SCSIO 43702 TaxID=2823043 RepID=UPI001C7306C9|nr:glutamate 5-kinase [Roseovarius sp. SCSIO 43702]QYX55473.1 glutamate 5-kinase [Roseovarius sp. SCSIO 43702]